MSEAPSSTDADIKIILLGDSAVGKSKCVQNVLFLVLCCTEARHVLHDVLLCNGLLRRRRRRLFFVLFRLTNF